MLRVLSFEAEVLHNLRYEHAMNCRRHLGLKAALTVGVLNLPGCLDPARVGPVGKPAESAANRAQARRAANVGADNLEQLQRNYIDLRFGMFIHFGILTYTGTWSQANLDINQFNPIGLDPGQSPRSRPR
jgi:hypothetical protein